MGRVLPKRHSFQSNIGTSIGPNGGEELPLTAIVGSRCSAARGHGSGAREPQSNGMAEAFVRTMKRDAHLNCLTQRRCNNCRPGSSTTTRFSRIELSAMFRRASSIASGSNREKMPKSWICSVRSYLALKGMMRGLADERHGVVRDPLGCVHEEVGGLRFQGAQLVR